MIDHSQPLVPQLTELGVDGVDLIASLSHTDSQFSQFVEALATQGKFRLIDDPAELNARLLKQKAASLHWEFMFTRSMFNTPDLAAQHGLLAEVARLVDDGTLRTTIEGVRGQITATNLRAAHEFIESGHAVGKVVLEGWPAQ